jgi:hypothetical protein
VEVEHCVASGIGLAFSGGTALNVRPEDFDANQWRSFTTVEQRHRSGLAPDSPPWKPLPLGLGAWGFSKDPEEPRSKPSMGVWKMVPAAIWNRV